MVKPSGRDDAQQSLLFPTEEDPAPPQRGEPPLIDEADDPVFTQDYMKFCDEEGEDGEG